MLESLALVVDRPRQLDPTDVAGRIDLLFWPQPDGNYGRLLDHVEFPGTGSAYPHDASPLAHTAAAAGVPSWQQALVVGTGSIVSLLLTAGACLYVQLRGPDPVALAVGFAAPLKFVPGTGFILFRLVGLRADSPEFDEYRLGELIGIPWLLPVGIGALCLCGGWFWLGRALPRSGRWAAVAAVATGSVTGIAVYLVLLGPWLLP